MTKSEGQSAAGRVWLAGAGPGDPGLITVRAAEVLGQADLVLYDGLVNPLLLRLARGRCERTSRIRREGASIVPQEEINRRLIEAARQGLNVVRLKGGDPCIFGRGGRGGRGAASGGDFVRDHSGNNGGDGGGGVFGDFVHGSACVVSGGLCDGSRGSAA